MREEGEVTGRKEEGVDRGDDHLSLRTGSNIQRTRKKRDNTPEPGWVDTGLGLLGLGCFRCLAFPFDQLELVF